MMRNLGRRLPLMPGRQKKILSRENSVGDQGNVDLRNQVLNEQPLAQRRKKIFSRENSVGDQGNVDLRNQVLKEQRLAQWFTDQRTALGGILQEREVLIKQYFDPEKDAANIKNVFLALDTSYDDWKKLCDAFSSAQDCGTQISAITAAHDQCKAIYKKLQIGLHQHYHRNDVGCQSIALLNPNSQGLQSVPKPSFFKKPSATAILQTPLSDEQKQTLRNVYSEKLVVLSEKYEKFILAKNESGGLHPNCKKAVDCFRANWKGLRDALETFNAKDDLAVPLKKCEDALCVIVNYDEIQTKYMGQLRALSTQFKACNTQYAAYITELSCDKLCDEFIAQWKRLRTLSTESFDSEDALRDAATSCMTALENVRQACERKANEQQLQPVGNDPRLLMQRQHNGTNSTRPPLADITHLMTETVVAPR